MFLARSDFDLPGDVKELKLLCKLPYHSLSDYQIGAKFLMRYQPNVNTSDKCKSVLSKKLASVQIQKLHKKNAYCSCS